MPTPLPPEFFRRPVLKVCPELLGKFLVRRLPDGTEIAGMIDEVEAYDGPSDLACHASKGKTGRTAVMFEPGGLWYIYLCYGIHWMLNIVTGERDYPSAILIRGVAGTPGPGRVTKLFQIDRALNTLPAAPESGLWIENRGVIIPKRKIKRTPRIGVNYAGPVWSEKPYRFLAMTHRVR